MGVIIIKLHVTIMLSNDICCLISVIYRVVCVCIKKTVKIHTQFWRVSESVNYMKPFLSKRKVKKKLN